MDLNDITTISSDDKSYVYALRCPDSKIIKYIGKADNPKRRYNSHMCDKNRSPKSSWIKSLKTQNKKPELVILGVYDKSIVYNMEIFWINYFKNFNNLKNLTSGGEGVSKPQSDETRKHISKKLTGVKKSKSHCENISKAMKGHINNPTALNLKAYWTEQSTNGYWEGKTRPPTSAETRKKIKENMKPNKKPILQLSLDGIFIKEWESIALAERELNVCSGKISMVCNGKRNMAFGFKWKFK